MPNFYKKMTQRERLLILICIGLVIIYLVFFSTPSEEVVVTPEVSVQKANVPVSMPTNSVVVPVTSQVNQEMRNPFAMLPEIKEEKKSANYMNPNQNSRNVPVGTENFLEKKQEVLRLTGIIGTADNRVAVIQVSNKSKAYQLNDFIGSYQLIATNEDFVILQNAYGRVILRLEPATQKGGDKSAK